MKRYSLISLALAALLLVTLLAGCGGSSSSDSKTLTATPAELADQMVEALAPKQELVEAGEKVISNYYAIDSEVITGYKVYISPAFQAEEIAVFSVADGRMDDAKAMVAKRVEDLKASFDGYLPDQLTQLEENAQILENGNCICLVTGQAEGAQAAAKIFTDAQ
ncbi:DUF4358 domain-containing protein [Angelakisella massiliensis]|uniref:DUF4358 domain-containing protein n=1 Tax=Angelakisella massiliensis TaxID=1871018 RepID=UPI0008F8C957|nr:DUF4358 domain-containing protein [Angelakisella massiliensis]